jgi:hypothetical protein
LPTGVRTASTMTASRMYSLLCGNMVLSVMAYL